VEQILSAELNGRAANQEKPIIKCSLAPGLECWTRQLLFLAYNLTWSTITFYCKYVRVEYYRISIVNVADVVV